MTTLAAVDLGASSGRVITGTLTRGRFELREAARFPNGPVEVPTRRGPRRHWDVLRLWESVTAGLRAASHDVGPLESVGIDTWAVDYGLLDADGELIGNPASYRCDRTLGAPEAFFAELPNERLYGLTGLQVQPFNTVFQLVAESRERLARAQDLLLVPDLLACWLTGRRVAEVTNASTTGILDPRTRRWRPEVLQVLAQRFDRDVSPLLADLVEPGHVVGPVNAGGLGLTTAAGEPTPLVAVGTHDTASAVVAIPAQREDFAYISCGTWSLVGLELDEPVLSDEARAANLTNELGVDGTVRFLKNVMGLWVFNESVRTWREQRIEVDVPGLVAQAAAVPALRTVIDVDDAAFFPPGDMPSRIAEAARRTGQPLPETPAEFARCIFDSLAIAYARAIRRSAEISGRDVGVVHIVGGGVRNELLCQLTADATGLPVVAGPDEGTALGNLVVQARAVGLLEGGLGELRDVVRASSQTRTYLPSGGAEQWERAAHRMG
ncbi:rhamnulokinase family protein [Tessaracoccus terricola]